jgi:hypothetical protein
MRSTLRNAMVLIAVMAGGCKEDDDEPEYYFDSSVLPSFDAGFDASRPDSGGLGGTVDSSIPFDSSVPVVDAGVTPGRDAAVGTDAGGDASAMDAGSDGGPGEGGLDGSAGDGGDGGPRDGGSDGGADGGRDGSAGDGGGDARVDAGPPATLTRVLTILRSNCGVCHTTDTEAELNFNANAGDVYDQLVGVPASDEGMCDGQNRTRVVPDEPENSLLIQKLEPSPPCGVRMPRFRTPLSPALINEIRSWIAAGAPEN